MASQSGTERGKERNGKKERKARDCARERGFICTRTHTAAVQHAYYHLLVEAHGHLPVKSVLAGIVELGNW